MHSDGPLGIFAHLGRVSPSDCRAFQTQLSRPFLASSYKKLSEGRWRFCPCSPKLARAQGGVAHPPNQGEVRAHFYSLGKIAIPNGAAALDGGIGLTTWVSSRVLCTTPHH